MVRPSRVAEVREVVYDERRWHLFKKLRGDAAKLMEALARGGFTPLLHGSLARGDVDEKSDVEVFIPVAEPSYKVELALAGFKPIKREIAMATPWQLPKAHIYVEENRLVSFPLAKPKPSEQSSITSAVRSISVNSRKGFAREGLIRG